MLKRGLSSTVVATLMVLISITAIGITAVTMMNQIRESSSDFQDVECPEINLVIENCIKNRTNTIVSINRLAGGGEITGIAFIFSNGSGRISLVRNNSLGEYEKTNFIFTNNEIFNPSSLIISAILKNGKRCTPVNLPFTCRNEDDLDFNQRLSCTILNSYWELDGATPTSPVRIGSNLTLIASTNEFCSGNIIFKLQKLDESSETWINVPLQNPLAQIINRMAKKNWTSEEGIYRFIASMENNNSINFMSQEIRVSNNLDCSNGLDDDGDGLIDYPIDPGCSSQNDDDETGESQFNKLYVYAWDLRNESLTNLVWLPMFGRDISGPWNNYGYRTLNASYMAQKLQHQNSTRPGVKIAIMDWNLWGGGSNELNHKQQPPLFNSTGDRCINSTTLERTNYPCPWLDEGRRILSSNYSSFFNNLYNNLSSIGLKLDILILDIEPRFSAWAIREWPCAGLTPNSQECLYTREQIQEIGKNFFNILQNEPRNNSLFTETGITNMTKLLRGEFPDVWIFDAKMIERKVRDIDSSIYDVVRDYYPNINLSNYGYSANKLISQQWGHETNKYIIGKSYMGTHQSPSLYTARIINICLNMTTDNVYMCYWNETTQQAPPGHIKFNSTPFNAFKYEVNHLRSAKLNSEAKLAPWISHKTFNDSLVRDSDLYQELLFHIVLTNPDFLIAWNPHPWLPNQHGQGIWASNQTDYLIDATMKEAEKIVWYPGRKTLVDSLSSWKADFVLTGMESHGRNVWRFTPNMDNLPLGDRNINTFIVSENAREVVLNTTNYTLTFTQGKIHRHSNSVSSHGLWIIQPANAQKPIIRPR